MDVGIEEGGAGCPLTAVASRFLPRLAEFAFEPGLVAAVDQHAAAVRSALIPAPRRPPEIETVPEPVPTASHASGSHALEPRRLRRQDLADYVLGFTDVLTENGWREPVGYDFATLRLTAVCWLIREDDLLAEGA